MKWRTVLCTALFLCGTVLLSACGGGEMPAPAEPPASSEVSAPSQPEEVPAPSESASSSEPEPPASSEPETAQNPWDGMVIPAGCKATMLANRARQAGIWPAMKFTEIGAECAPSDGKAVQYRCELLYEKLETNRDNDSRRSCDLKFMQSAFQESRTQNQMR